MRLAEKAGLRSLSDQWLSVPTDKGAHAGLEVQSLVAGMTAGADSVDHIALPRHGGMKKIFTSCYAPSTLGSFLRSFTFGHVRQLVAVTSRFLVNLAEKTLLVPSPAAGDGGLVFVDVDDTFIEVHGYQKQGAGFGYSGIRGINALLATVSTTTTSSACGGRRPTPAERSIRVLAGCRADRRRRSEDRDPVARPDGPGVAAGRFRPLRLRDSERGPACRCCVRVLTYRSLRGKTPPSNGRSR